MTLLIFLIVLSVLIFVHELGHFLAARRAGIKVEEFGFGFPPRVWGKKIGETIYSVNAIPFGGFVRLYGEDADVKEDKERSFYNQGKATRARVISAGVFMNFLLGVFAFSIIGWFLGVPQATGEVKVIKTAEGSPAVQAGLKEGDIVTQVNSRQVKTSKDFQQIVNQNKGEEISLLVKRGQDVFTARATPRISPPENEGALGVVITDIEIAKPPLYKRPFVVFWQGLKEAVFWVTTVVLAVAQAIGQAARGTAPEGLAGPVGIFQLTGQVARSGALSLMSFIGILSVNLAVLNILPFPALDGGRLLFIFIEGIVGRRVIPRVERVAHTVGMILLLLLLLLITIQDIGRLLSGGFDFPTPQ